MKKRKDLDRLREYRAAQGLRAIEKLEDNKPWVQHIMTFALRQDYPGVVACTYEPRTHCLTIRYIGLCVQWFAHTDKLHIQHGNEKTLVSDVAPQHLHMRLLHQGRKGFM